MRRTSCLPLLAVLALTGCGAAASSSEEFEGEERRVAEVVEDLQEAGQDREARRICRQILAPVLLERLGAGCETRIDDALKTADSFELEVEDVRIAGSRAFARVQSGPDEGDDRRLELLRVGREWRVASLGA